MADKPSPTVEARQMSKLLLAANRLNFKAYKCDSLQSLIFLILNDTIEVARYDRAILWEMSGKEPRLLGVSGQSKLTKSKPLINKWLDLVKKLKEPSKPQLFVIERHTETNFLKETGSQAKSTVLWLPIFAQDKLILGLWLEVWGSHKESLPPDDLVSLLVHLVMPSYGLAWEKLTKKSPWRRNLSLKKASYAGFGLIFLAAISLIQVPLRIVAPCEVVPLDPVVIRAPMEGIIDRVVVEPGQKVQEDAPLVEYDKRVTLQQLKIAQKEVEILESELNRAIASSLDEDKLAAEKYAILLRKLEKQKIELNLAKYRASQLTVKAPLTGIVMLNNPEEFRGKPVKVGEKILSMSDSDQTKVKIWIPEGDNVEINFEQPITIILNVEPNRDYLAKLTYISSEVSLSDKKVPSFTAEAAWVDKEKELKIGLQGIAIIYGEKASLGYFFARKPLAKIRYYLGV